MGGGEAVWLIAGGEPGAQRFGQLVQRLRKEKHMSVEELAQDAGLSVGTIRAIEQARRAPSEESGLRLLRLLLPEGSLLVEQKASNGTQQNRPDIAFLDPESGARVVLQFKARTAGDNRLWSSDKPRASESKAEAFIRELMADPDRPEWQRLKETAAYVGAVFAEVKALASRPAREATFGRIVRRLSARDEIRLELLEKLLDLWDRVDAGVASQEERDRTFQVNALLDMYVFPDEDVPSSSE